MELNKNNQIEIKETSNGFIVKSYEQEEDGYTENTQVIETSGRHLSGIGGNNKENSENMKKLFEVISELLGYGWDSYTQDNLRILTNGIGRKIELKKEDVKPEDLDKDTLDRLKVLESWEENEWDGKKARYKIVKEYFK